MPRSTKGGDTYNVTDVNPDALSRRQLIELGATGAVLGLAGCAGDGDGGGDATATETEDGEGMTETATEGGGGEPKDPELTNSWDKATMDKLGWNQLNPNQVMGNMGKPAIPRLGAYGQNGDVNSPFIENIETPESIEEGSTVAVTLRDDITYHNGDPMTAQTVAEDLDLRQQIQGFGNREYAGAEAVDDTTFEIESAVSIADQLFLIPMFGNNVGDFMWLSTPGMKPFREAYYDASNDDERKSLVQEWSKKTMPGDIEFHGYGPIVYQEHSAQEAIFDIYDDYHLDINFPRFRTAQTEGSTIQALKNDVLDYQVVRGPEELNPNNWPDSQPRKITKVSNGGTAFTMNVREPQLRNRRVRQAIATAINPKAILLDTSPPGVSDEVAQAYANQQTTTTATNMTNGALSAWDIKDVVRENTRWGPVEANVQEGFDQAATMLEDEGWTKESGTWLTPDGETWEPLFISTTFWATWMKPIHQQLQSFGINSKLKVLNGSVFWSDQGIMATGENRNWAFSPNTWARNEFGLTGPHPYIFFNGTNFRMPLYGVYERYAEGEGDNQTLKLPVEEFYDPEGDIQEVNYTQKLTELGQTNDEQRISELANQLGWTLGRFAASIPVFQNRRATILFEDDWNFPSGSDPLNHATAYRSHDYPLAAGAIQAKTE